MGGPALVGPPPLVLVVPFALVEDGAATNRTTADTDLDDTDAAGSTVQVPESSGPTRGVQ